jgi:hypothetical protein
MHTMGHITCHTAGQLSSMDLVVTCFFASAIVSFGGFNTAPGRVTQCHHTYLIPRRHSCSSQARMCACTQSKQTVWSTCSTALEARSQPKIGLPKL